MLAAPRQRARLGDAGVLCTSPATQRKALVGRSLPQAGRCSGGRLRDGWRSPEVTECRFQGVEAHLALDDLARVLEGGGEAKAEQAVNEKCSEGQGDEVGVQAGAEQAVGDGWTEEPGQERVER